MKQKLCLGPQSVIVLRVLGWSQDSVQLALSQSESGSELSGGGSSPAVFVGQPQ